jgi:hypothetical protein
MQQTEILLDSVKTWLVFARENVQVSIPVDRKDLSLIFAWNGKAVEYPGE